MCFTRNIWSWRVSRWKNSREISAIPGHMIIVHGLYSRSSPGHSRPPKFGGGWLQARVRVRVPFSHVTEHFPHEDHKLQAPLTEKRRLKVSTVLQRSLRLIAIKLKTPFYPCIELQPWRSTGWLRAENTDEGRTGFRHSPGTQRPTCLLCRRHRWSGLKGNSTHMRELNENQTRTIKWKQF